MTSLSKDPSTALVTSTHSEREPPMQPSGQGSRIFFTFDPPTKKAAPATRSASRTRPPGGRVELARAQRRDVVWDRDRSRIACVACLQRLLKATGFSVRFERPCASTVIAISL